MKAHVLVSTVLVISSTNGFFLDKIGERLHNIANAVIPHEHHHRHHEHCGHFEGHQHDHRQDVGLDLYQPPDSQEYSDYRRGAGYRRPPHRHPEPDHYSEERPYRRPLNKPASDDYGKDEGSSPPTTETIQVEVTTNAAGGEEPEVATVMAIDVRSGADVSSRRIINPGSNCGGGQKLDAIGRCRAVFG